MEKQGWTHLTLIKSFVLCCFKLCNLLHTINCDIWLLSITTTSFLHWLIIVLLLLKIFTLEQTFLLLQESREVDDPGLLRGLYIGNTASLIRAPKYLQTL